MKHIDKALADSFYDVVSNVRLLQLVTMKNGAPHNMSSLKAALKDFEKYCNKIKSDTYIIYAFKDYHYEEMTRIVFYLRSQPSLRSYHDRIFKNIFNFANHDPRNITHVFDEFIKGITYFEVENPTNEPVYHRLSACGDGTDAFRRLNNQCTSDLDRKAKNEIKSKIEKCYLERLIYDRLYQDTELTFDQPPVQDQGHLKRLEETKKDFQSCFPHVDIDVHIEYDAHMPVKLVITKSVKNNPLIREEYTKRIVFGSAFGDNKMYDKTIDCYKEVIGGNAQYVRTQRYEGRLKRWIKLTR